MELTIRAITYQFISTAAFFNSLDSVKMPATPNSWMWQSRDGKIRMRLKKDSVPCTRYHDRVTAAWSLVISRKLEEGWTDIKGVAGRSLKQVVCQANNKSK